MAIQDTGYKYIRRGNQYEAIPNLGDVPYGGQEVNYQDFISGARQQGISALQGYKQGQIEAPGIGQANIRAAQKAFEDYGGESGLGALMGIQTGGTLTPDQISALEKSTGLGKNYPGIFNPQAQSGIQMLNGVPTETSKINPTTGQVDINTTFKGPTLDSQLQPPINTALSNQAAQGIGAIPGFNTQTGQVVNPQVYQQAQQALKGSGQPAPLTQGPASSTIQNILPPAPQVNPVLDNLFAEDKNIGNFSKQIQDYLSPQTQQTTLKQEYESLIKAKGIEGMNTELMNMKNVIEGAEDDIRTEITKAGGFATESQVMALTNARNKTLIKNYNNLLQTKQQAQDYVDTLIGLSKEDKQTAQQRMDSQMNLSLKLADLQQNMQKNAQDTLNKIVTQVGYDGIAQMTQGNPYYTSLVEQTLGLGAGGLAQLSNFATIERNKKESKELLDLDLKSAQIQNIYSEIKKRNEETGMQVDPTNIIAYAQQYASTGTIPSGIPKGTFGLVSQYAKELPKSPGQILDKATGVTPDKLGAAGDAYGALYSAIELAGQLKELDKQRMGGVVSGTLGKIFGSQNQSKYIDLRTQIVDLLARARSGAALTTTEEARYSNMLPGRFSEPLGLGTQSDVRIDNFISALTSDLTNKVNSKGWVINGVSTVKIGNDTFKVGDIISNGTEQGRVNADGSITKL